MGQGDCVFVLIRESQPSLGHVKDCKRPQRDETQGGCGCGYLVNNQTRRNAAVGVKCLEDGHWGRKGPMLTS